MNILLLAGGNSNERDVSLSSSTSMYRALVGMGHEVTAIDPSGGHEYSLIGGTLATESQSWDKDALPPIAPQFVSDVLAGRFRTIDVVVFGLHGGAGENGMIQNLLEFADLAYTGSGPTASAVGMDKALSKRIMASLDIPTPAFRFLKNGQEAGGRVLEAIQEQFSLPLIVKPNAGGSTVGLTVVQDWSDLRAAIDTAAREKAGILIEDYVRGRELTVAVVDGDPLPVVEIKPKSGLYDYEAKYTKGKTEYIAPAEIPEQVALRIQADAVRFFDAIGASGLARVDFMLDEEGGHHCLELNTLPGMTELSLSPMAAKAAGQSFEQLLERIINSALKHRQN